MAIRLLFKVRRHNKKIIWKEGPYFEFNNKKRKEAKARDDRIGNVIFKWLNNACYRKTIEIEFNRQDVELVNDINSYRNLVENVNFK